ncbi:MFS transporter [Streptomyces kunmingensis]|uniref:MFS transporter n=1 Tax=Streptomyces kunmingensis TaxID=68225 RepID=A0ABU6CA80_9ACTN|nr:MFS transporter [Streptomyces kunmingensis]MEB3961384.1 MFS transporter [Streptomyces kunmingensis]
MSLRRGGVGLLACTAGIALANNYAVQPALGDVARSTGTSAAAIGLVTTAALTGCIAGFAFLLPLADRAAPRRLVTGQLVLLAAGLVLAASAGGLGLLLVAYGVIGAGASVSAGASTIAGRGVPAERRGAAVALVAAGMSAGILLSRLVGGALSDALGWRGMLLTFAGLVLLCAAGAWLRLPDERPAPTGSYLATLTALPGLLRRHRTLRRAVLTGSLWYFAFSLVWVALTVRLAQPPYGLDAAAIGLYSLAGALGFAALPVAGRLGDRFGPRLVICASMAVAATGAALLCTGLDRPAVTAVGLALVDAGCFTAQAANQTRILGVDPRRAGSLSGVYLLLYFLAGVVGSALAAPLIESGGWTAASGAVLVALLLAGLLALRRDTDDPGDATERPGHECPGRSARTGTEL